MLSQTFFGFALMFIIIYAFRMTSYMIQMYNFDMVYKGIPVVLDVHDLKFSWYVKDFKKNYDYKSKEYGRRFLNFKASLKEIARLNAIEGNTVFGLTKFSDWSKQEFAERMLMKPDIETNCQPDYNKTCVNTTHYSSESSVLGEEEDIPLRYDWRAKNYVGPVLDQKLCSGCWAFSIVGVMESMAAKRYKKFTRFSIQELLDCSKFNCGCLGGDVYIALSSYLCSKKEPGVKVVTEEVYPLTLTQPQSQNCTLINKNEIGTRLQMYDYQCNVTEGQIVRQIREHGPLVAAVDARNWMNYIGGIIRRACIVNDLNHVVQIVGYDAYGTGGEDVPYYIIRNSYGEDFGDNGYVKIAIGENVCGIASQVTRLDVI